MSNIEDKSTWRLTDGEYSVKIAMSVSNDSIKSHVKLSFL